MADEVRRSGRANKGHHTKNQDALDEPIPKPKAKGKSEKKAQATQPARSQSAQTENQEEEEDAVIRCVCGDQRDIRGRQMIACDICEAWQHVKCLGLQEGDEWNEKTYYCEQCKPEDHVELLAAMARGEKPWNRKKGAKHAKAKPRLSEVKPDGEPEPRSKATTPVIAAPQPAPKEQPKQTSNGKPESKPAKKEKEGQTSQPQSPVGEKRRRDTTVENDGVEPKRRKSSAQQHEKAPQLVAMGTDVAALPEKQRLLVEALVKNLQAMVKQASESRGYRIPDGETPSSVANRLALQIDRAAVQRHGEPPGNDSPYVLQVRSIMFNVKKNPVLIDRLLSGSLTADGIAAMTAEEMASEDKQREYAALREANEKQIVLTEEQGPRIRKTHKGEELVEHEQARTTEESAPPAPEWRHRDSMQEETRAPEDRSPQNSGSPMRAELPEDVGRAPLTVDTSTAQSATVSRPTPSAAFDVKEVWKHVRSPDQEQQALRRQSSIATQVQHQEGPGDDADIDRLLKDEDNDTVMGDFSADPTVCWQGTVDMQAVGAFSAVARFVAGGDIGQTVPWAQLLSSTLPIQGRIDKEKGNEYLSQMSTSATLDLAVLTVSPVNHEGRTRMDAMFNYFHPRNRWGVVPVEKLGNESMRDLYVIPIEAGGSNLPGFLDMLEHCTIETPRPQAMIVLALVAKMPEQPPANYPATPFFNHHSVSEIAVGQIAVPQPQQQQQQQQQQDGLNRPLSTPSHPPPQFSPMTAFPHGPNYGSPYPPPALGHQQGPPLPPPQFNGPLHHQNKLARDIFGPDIDAPVIVQILTAVPHIREHEMLNLKAILEREPAARSDMGILQQHLSQASTGAARG
ncbi:hypothetical protein GQ43DRAFT_439295 [Delitschia confertaspora ATCC 74209]|uniref:Transcription factor BYE1 n=1 Tax=Delitschia confertaspora ATCC 74209 TaxID=1513339 RepID=A0A9P4JTF1_9PLEO|nr:hypothetical protein GQ43DRAFT_439295 [Delitschia confertaspora ATCC 74209]